METLLKTKQIDVLKHAVASRFDIDKYWDSIKICVRNNYTITDASIWRDYIDLLLYFGKDTHNARYVCPTNLQAEHDKLARKKARQIEREKLEKAKRKAIEHENKYRELKQDFFGIFFTDGTIDVRVLESVREFAEEGVAMHHCVFANEYYLKPDSLILSATINGERIETVEVSLKTHKVVQSRGACNQNTEYHQRIVNLVNRNMKLITNRIVS